MNNKSTETEGLIKKFDELCDIEPSKVCLDIYQYEKRHSDMVLKQYGRFVSQFELYYDLIVEITHAVNYIEKTKWPKYRGLQFLILAHNLKSLFSSFDRLIKGYYEDSLVLARPVYEAFIKIIYITCYPENPYGVITGKTEPRERKFNLTNFLKNELKLDWDHYFTLSAIAHANYYSVVSEAVKRDKGKKKEAVALRFKFEKKLFQMGVNYINFLLLVFLKIIVCLFTTSHNNILKKEMIAKAKELIILREKALPSPEEYWLQVIQDIKDIISMIELTETGKDWKESWKSVRGIN